MKEHFLSLVILFLSFSIKAQWKGFSKIDVYQVTSGGLLLTKDITGDAILDITVIHPADQTQSSFLTGKGNGSFTSEQLFSKETNYVPSDIADFNKDGIPDLVMSSYWANGIKVYIGKGMGTFHSGTYYPTNVHGKNVKCVDINKDGKMDIIAVTTGSGQPIRLHVFLGKGDGFFEEKRTYSSVLHTDRDIIITDKNSDGLLDVIVSTSFAWVLIYYQQPDGSFIPDYWPTTITARVAFGDINGDKKEDMVLGYSSFDNNPGDDSIVVKLNTGGTNWSSSIHIPNSNSYKIRPLEIKTADLNLDGHQDIITTHVKIDGEYSDTLFYFLGNGNTTFQSALPIRLPANIRRFNVEDMNKDGYPDIIAVSSDNRVMVLLNQNYHSGESNPAILLYPNPTDNYIRLITPKEGSYTITMYNALGQKVYMKSNSIREQLLYVNHFPAGNYFLQIIYPDKKFVKQFVVK